MRSVSTGRAAGSSSLVTLGLTLLILLLAAPVLGAEPQASETCGLCHRDIYTMWKGSAHARSMESLIFQEALGRVRKEHGPASARVCLGCHAPILQVSSDAALRQKATWEGVSCEVCHSLAAVDPGVGTGTPKLVFDLGEVKRGPIRDTVSTGHEVAFSELHTQALACAGCHEYVNPEGVRILATFSEWKQSTASRQGTTCQSCHMGRTAANVVDPRVLRVSGAVVNVHEVPGGHSLAQLHKALSATIEAQRPGNELALVIRLTNKGAGHAVPTGMPGRRLILRVEVSTSSGATFKAERTYGRFFKDAAGEAITHDDGYFEAGVKEVSDSRLRPDERRLESFKFPVPAADTAYVTLTMLYEHAPLGGPEGRSRLTFLTEKRIVRPRPAGR